MAPLQRSRNPPSDVCGDRGISAPLLRLQFGATDESPACDELGTRPHPERLSLRSSDRARQAGALEPTLYQKNAVSPRNH
jgi:hypothetical protein